MEEKRILAIDYGSKRIGLAITDPLNIFAYPLITLSNNNKLFIQLLKIINEFKVVKIIVGAPFKESGENSNTSLEVEKFVVQLKKHTEVDIELFDERYSSEIAKQRIIESVVSKKKRRDKTLIDKNAAAVILEDYLKTMK